MLIGKTASWKMPGIFQADAQKVANEIYELGNNITPKQVVERAKDEQSELHKCFEWNDKEAAEKFRLQQARKVLTMLVVESPKILDQAKTTRMFYKLDNKHDSGYTKTEIIIKDKDKYNQLIEQAYKELLAFQKKYNTLNEFSAVFEAINQIAI